MHPHLYQCGRVPVNVLFENLTDEMIVRKGTASGVVFTPLATAYIIAGHENHHIQIIKERYL